MPFVSLHLPLPPVYSAIRIRALAKAGAGLVRRARDAAVQEATRLLQLLYPQRDVLLTDSGTSALTLALQLTTSHAGMPQIVALPAFACPDIGTAAIGAGCTVVLYDLCQDTLEPQLASVEACLQAGATHVVVTHLFGRIANVREVATLATRYGAVVIEDAAQHAGGGLGGIRGGGLADWSVLSFGRGKGLNAGGGGALLRAQAANAPPSGAPLSHPTSSVPVLVKATAVQLLTTPWLYWIPSAIPALQLGATNYHPPSAPRGISTASATLLADVLAEEATALRFRRSVESHYWEALGAHGPVSLRRPDAAMQSGALRFPVRLPAAIGERLQSHGVARSYPRMLNEYPEIAESCRTVDTPLDGAQALARSLYTLPTHDRVSQRARDHIVTTLQTITA